MDIAARIYTINGFSAHAGQDQLLSWLEPLVHDKANVVLVHGEEKAQTTLSGLIKEKFGVTPLVPGYMEEMILEGHQVAQTVQHEALGPADRTAGRPGQDGLRPDPSPFPHVTVLRGAALGPRPSALYGMPRPPIDGRAAPQVQVFSLP